MATTYVVLRAEDGAWRELKKLYANSADQAIRLAIDPDSQYVAIPEARLHYRGPEGFTEEERSLLRAAERVES